MVCLDYMKLNNNHKINPVPLIIDTDLGNDIDDALALSLTHALQNGGECRLLGVAVNKDNKYSPALVDIINTYYNRGDIEIGTVAGGKTPEDGTFLKPVVEAKIDGEYKYRRTYDDYRQDAVKMYRKILGEAEDNSVAVVSIGFLTNLARLLVSERDEYSELNGLELVSKKVRLLSVMAGNFSEDSQSTLDAKYAEYNVKLDIKSARFVCRQWPTEMLFSGHEVGSGIMYPAQSIYDDYKWTTRHPVVDAYKLYLEMPYDRQTWDLTSVLCAVRNPEMYFGLSQAGRVEVLDDGVTKFNANENGRHRYLILVPDKIELIRNLMTERCSQKPMQSHKAAVAVEQDYFKL